MPFLVKGQQAIAIDDGWILMLVIGVHNHTTAEHLKGHSFSERLSSEETSLLGK